MSRVNAIRSMGKADYHYPVVVIGGGPCGLAAALGILNQELGVAVIEKTDYNQKRIGEHLPPSALGIFAELGIPDHLIERDHLPCAGVMSWWGHQAPVHTVDYYFHPMQHGINLSRPRFDRDLADFVRQRGATIHERTTIHSIHRHGGLWHIELSTNGQERIMTTPFVIDASGKSASFARTQGSRILAGNPQVAIIRYGSINQAPAQDHKNHIVIESCPTGWWYFAPLAAGQAVAMFMTDVDVTPLHKSTLLTHWDVALQSTNHIADRLQPYVHLQKPVVCLSRSQRLDCFQGENWLAAGDAAMTFDPLSSHGISKGLRHGWMAGKAVATFTQQGDRRALERFDRDLEYIFSEYLKTRTGYYATEQRWPESRFWSRRHATDPLSGQFDIASTFRQVV